jgi:LPXTG-motif cell wall-anchored protein
MKRTIIGGLFAAATLFGGFALTPASVSAAGDTITVDGNVYPQSFDNNGTVHFDTPGATTVTSASTTANGGQKWDGANGAEKLPCPGGIHWVSNDSRLVISHCNDAPPAAMVTYSEWVDGTWECDDTTVVQTRIVTTTPYTFDGEEWVLDESKATTSEEKDTRDLTPAEQSTCPVEVTPPNPPVENQVASQSPMVPAQAPTTQAGVVAATPTQELPSTGNSSWVTALIALVALAGGTGLVRLSRRTTD